jgi:hypothetical protein
MICLFLSFPASVAKDIGSSSNRPGQGDDRGDFAPGEREDLLDRSGGWHRAAAAGISRDERVVASADTLVERGWFPVEAVRLVAGRAGLAVVRAGEADGDIQIVDEGQVGRQPFSRKLVELVNQGEWKATTVALVGNSCIIETIGENDPARLEGRPDELADVLGAISGVEEQLGQWID